MEQEKFDPKRTSKFLSFVLRHDPGCAGITLDDQGWTDVEKLLAATKLSKDQLDTVVNENSKKRFAYSDDGMMG